MSPNHTTRLENRSRPRIFSSPIALAFVRTIIARRGITEQQARKVYSDYLNRSQPAGIPAARSIA